MCTSASPNSTSSAACIPPLGFDYYVDVLRALKQAYPWVHLKAFTGVEIDFFAQLTGMDHRTDAGGRLIEAGLGSMPGGGAEIFHPDIRRKICPEKADADTWLAMCTASPTTWVCAPTPPCSTATSNNYEHRVDHLLRLREQQDRSGGFKTFIPLRYHPENNNLGRRLDWTTAHDTLKTMAVSRLMLDNFPHVKAYWIMLTPPIAQLALHFGADDIDGTVVEEKIYHDAGATTDEQLDKFDLLRLIKAIGKTPVERDTLYNVVEIYDQPIEAYAPDSRKTRRGDVKITSIELA